MSADEVSPTLELSIDDAAIATDGPCGEVDGIVVDPSLRSVTHLVIQPPHRSERSRLVPLEVLDVTPAGVLLHVTLAQFAEFPAAEEVCIVPAGDAFADYGPGQGMSFSQEVLPVGDVAIRRGSPVEATDGKIGHVRGVRVATPDHRMTHLVLHEGHLFGRKDVSIPISAVIGMRDGIRLSLSKQQIQDLPARVEKGRLRG